MIGSANERQVKFLSTKATNAIMPKPATHRTRPLRALTFAALAAGAVLVAPGTARAEKVSPTAKGTVGGALVGAEVVTFGEALFGVRSPLAYIVGAGVGAAGGGVGGYFIEKSVDDGRIPAYILAGGLALIIPALVVAFDQTRYLPSEGAREDKPVPGPESNPGNPGGSSVLGAEPGKTAPPAPTTPPANTPDTTPTPPPAPAPAPAPSGGGGGGGGTPMPVSLFDVHQGELRVGLPVPEVRPILGSAERTRLGADNRGSELRFPVMRLTF